MNNTTNGGGKRGGAGPNGKKKYGNEGYKNSDVGGYSHEK